jgi:hypothetical protein
MTHMRLDRKDEARTGYEKAAGWVEKNAPKNERLIRLRAEAAALLGISDTPLTEKEKTEGKG